MEPHIFVVNDDPDSLELMSNVLRPAGFRVSTAPLLDEPPDALALLDRIQPDLLLLDIVRESELPGLALVRALRDSTTYSQLPIIVCTTAVRIAGPVMDELLALSVAIVHKPFDLDDLLDAIRRAPLLANGNGGATNRPSGTPERIETDR